MARSGVGSPSPNIMILAVHITGGPLSPAAPDRNDFQNARLRGGAGRTRTNHQSVMEHGSSPTNSPGRTLTQFARRFAVLLDFPGFLILEPTPECYGTWFESDQLPWSHRRVPMWRARRLS